MQWRFIEVPVVTPFSFGMYASRIKEGMMLEDPERQKIIDQLPGRKIA